MLRRLMDRLRGRSADDQPTAAPAARNYAQEREDRSHAQMSDEDRAWGEASRQRDQENRGHDQPAPGNT